MPLFFEDDKPKIIEKKTLFGSVKERTNPKPKKEVKFTWKGLGNLIRTLAPTDPRKFERLVLLASAEEKPQENLFCD